MNWLRWAPLAVFALLAGLFAVELTKPELSCNRPDADLDRPLPAFDVEMLPPEPGRFTPERFAEADGPTLVNIWASWCAPCRAEHPQLMKLSEIDGLRMVGVDYKDKPPAGRTFLQRLGDPFDSVMFDPDGEAAVAFGITGVPETFIVSPAGRIVYRHVGQITPKDVTDCILPALERAK